MTVEEAIKYAEKKKLQLEEKIERPGSAYGAYAMHSTELEFVSMAISALCAQQQLESNLKVLESNEPLTVDELRKIDGEPVYIHSDTFPGDCGWRVIKKASVLDIQFTDGDCFLFIFYGKSWIAYRRKPQEVQK